MAISVATIAVEDFVAIAVKEMPALPTTAVILKIVNLSVLNMDESAVRMVVVAPVEHVPTAHIVWA
jgi:hypothetical protein